jgi:NAD(P)-dependent dehydrogenase (short-subunit alcohol dehydrogenase family)
MEIQKSTQKPLAIVTGAAHRLGRAIALELAAQGYAIGLHFFNSVESANATRDELAQAGVPVFLLQADLTQPEQIEDLFERAARLPQPLQVLVNSAAVMEPANARTMPVALWDETMNLNLRAPWLCARAAANLMDNHGGGVIINVSDSGAQRPWSGYAAYVVSKAALEALTRLLARALAPGVRVNAVAPGLILPPEDFPPEQWQRLIDRLPLRTSGDPQDIARAVTFLIQNPHITGQVLVVDGGYQLV